MRMQMLAISRCPHVRRRSSTDDPATLLVARDARDRDGASQVGLVVFSRRLATSTDARAGNDGECEKEELYIRRSAKATVSAKFSSRWKRLRDPRCEVRETEGGGGRKKETVTHKK